MFQLSNSSMFLHPAITVHLLTPGSTRTGESAVAINLPVNTPGFTCLFAPCGGESVGCPRLLRAREGEMKCALQYISEVKALAEFSQRGYNSSAVCGGPAKHVLDHTALFLRSSGSCDSAFLFSAWPLDTVHACSAHAHTHTHSERASTHTCTGRCRRRES